MWIIRRKPSVCWKSSDWSGYLQKKSGGVLVFQLPQHLIPELNRELIRLGINVYSLQARNSLEAYFLSLTRSKQNVAAFTD